MKIPSLLLLLVSGMTQSWVEGTSGLPARLYKSSCAMAAVARRASCPWPSCVIRSISKKKRDMASPVRARTQLCTSEESPMKSILKELVEQRTLDEEWCKLMEIMLKGFIEQRTRDEEKRQLMESTMNEQHQRTLDEKLRELDVESRKVDEDRRQMDEERRQKSLSELQTAIKKLAARVRKSEIWPDFTKCSDGEEVRGAEEGLQGGPQQEIRRPHQLAGLLRLNVWVVSADTEAATKSAPIRLRRMVEYASTCNSRCVQDV